MQNLFKSAVNWNDTSLAPCLALPVYVKAMSSHHEALNRLQFCTAPKGGIVTRNADFE